MGELIKNYVNGLTFIHRNVDSLYDTMCIAIEKPEYICGKLSNRGYLYSQDRQIPSISTHIDEILGIYYTLLLSDDNNNTYYKLVDKSDGTDTDTVPRSISSSRDINNNSSRKQQQYQYSSKSKSAAARYEFGGLISLLSEGDGEGEQLKKCKDTIETITDDSDSIRRIINNTVVVGTNTTTTTTDDDTTDININNNEKNNNEKKNKRRNYYIISTYINYKLFLLFNISPYQNV